MSGLYEYRSIPTWASRTLEIETDSARRVGVTTRVPQEVFGASLFHPVGGVTATASISHGRGPRRREHALILDRELELQVLAPIVRGPHALGDVMLLGVPCKPVFGGFGIEQPIPFDHAQSLGLRRAMPVHHG